MRLYHCCSGLEDSRKGLRSQHAHTADTLENLSRIYEAKRDYNSALPLMKRMLEIDEKTLGPDSSPHRLGLLGLADLY